MKTFFLDTNEPATQAQLDELGVLYWNVPADSYEQDGILDKICKEQGYNYREIVRPLVAYFVGPPRQDCVEK
jgi:hypothetical protein